jgi:hypothetical protein
MDQVKSIVASEGVFTIPANNSRQIMIEVFYDPQFYDVEILMESKETVDTRSHIYKRESSVDVSTFKGAKRAFIEAESGEYVLQIIVKIPPITSSSMNQYAPKYTEFQLYAVAATHIPSMVLRPASLNYFGLIGPTGKGFG